MVSCHPKMSFIYFLCFFLNIIICDEFLINVFIHTAVFLLMTAANGVVIATEKKLPSILVDETSVSTQILLVSFSSIILLW